MNLQKHSRKYNKPTSQRLKRRLNRIKKYLNKEL